MAPEELRIIFTFAGSMACLVAVTTVVVMWIRRPRGIGTLPPEIAERLERIERAVDVTALEVERIGEGQRFLTRALSERGVAEPSRPDARGHVITPH